MTDHFTITHTEPDGTIFSYNPATGESELRSPDGTYFRNAEDYDHGWVWRKPGMSYSQKRRSRRQVITDRASYLGLSILTFAVGTVWAIAFGSFAATVGNTTAGIWVALGTLPIFLYISYRWWKYNHDSLFHFLWYGQLNRKD